jgi:selenide, water dikinase
MGLATLAQVLRPLQERFRPDEHPQVLVGLDVADDAAVIRVSDDLALVQTLDFFPPVVDDPFTYGQVAAANAMSDVYAMGGEVWMALQIAAFPEDLDPAILAEIFRGGADKVAEAGGVIAGGHTVYDVEPKYGLSVTGVVHPDAIIRTGGAQPGDALLLTKPVGTGVLMTAAKQQREGHEAGLAAAVSSMLALNRHPAHLARAAGVHAMTDVTGFGLLGHLSEMLEGSAVAARIDVSKCPRYAGTDELLRGGARSTLLPENLALAHRVTGSAATEQALALLFDPQTSGGLVAGLPPARATAVLEALRRAGETAVVIGEVTTAVDGNPSIELS